MPKPLQDKRNPLFNKDFKEQCNLIINWQSAGITPESLFSLTDDYTDKDLNNACKNLSFRFHPDRNISNKELATEVIYIVNAAKDYLKDKLNPEDNLPVDNIFNKKSYLQTFLPQEVYEMKFFKPYKSFSEFGISLAETIARTTLAPIFVVAVSSALLLCALAQINRAIFSLALLDKQGALDKGFSALWCAKASVIILLDRIVLTVCTVISLLTKSLSTIVEQASRPFQSVSEIDEDELDSDEPHPLLST